MEEVPASEVPARFPDEQIMFVATVPEGSGGKVAAVVGAIASAPLIRVVCEGGSAADPTSELGEVMKGALAEACRRLSGEETRPLKCGRVEEQEGKLDSAWLEGAFPGCSAVTRGDFEITVPDGASVNLHLLFPESFAKALETALKGAKGSGEVRPAAFQELSPSHPGEGPRNLDLLLDVGLCVRVELGRTALRVQEVLELGPGSVVELDKLAGEPVDLLVNEQLFARGEVVVIDENFGVRVTDIVSPVERVQAMRRGKA